MPKGKYYLVMVVLIAALTIFLAGCGWPLLQRNRVDLIICAPGSLKPIIEKFATIYEQDQHDAQFVIKDVSGRSSMQMVADNTVDAALTYFNEGIPAGLLMRQVGVMPYVFFANSAIGVKNLTSAQICGILTGGITNWREVGGNDSEIVVLHPNFNTALPQAVKAQFMQNKDFPGLPLYSDESADLPERVERTRGAIAYQDVVALDKMNGYFYRIEVIAIDGMLPYQENLKNNTYKAVLPINLVYQKEGARNEKMISFLASKLEQSDFFLRKRVTR